MATKSYEQYVNIPLTKGLFSIVDKEDLGSISKYSWQAIEKSSGFYARTTQRVNGNKISFYLSRFIIKAKKGEYVDHINGNTLDNRKQNLRICTNRQNIRNSKVKKNNNLGLKGVTFNKNKGLKNPFRARITVNYEEINLGYFLTAEEAASIYNEAARMFFGEYARINKL